jgi:hypothetical protein
MATDKKGMQYQSTTVDIGGVGASFGSNPQVDNALLDNTILEWTRMGWELFSITPIANLQGRTTSLLLIFKVPKQ